MKDAGLLQHQIGKMGVVTVMDVLLKDIETGEPLLLLDTLKITSISQEGESKTIRGGIGAPELIDYDFARSVTVTIQDALASLHSLQMLWGGRFIEGDIQYTSVFEARIELDGEDKVVALPDGVTPLEGDKLTQALILSTSADAAYTAESIKTNKIVLSGAKLADAKVNETVKVFILAKIAEGTGALALAINSLDLPPTVHMVGSTYFIDRVTGKKVPMEIEIPLLKINIGGELSMEAEGDAAVFDFNGKALQDPKTKNFFIMKQLPLA